MAKTKVSGAPRVETFNRFASVRVLQCVAACGFSVVVTCTISAATSVRLAGGLPPRDASRSMPARPDFAKRFRHRQTVFIPV